MIQILTTSAETRHGKLDFFQIVNYLERTGQ